MQAKTTKNRHQDRHEFRCTNQRCSPTSGPSSLGPRGPQQAPKRINKSEPEPQDEKRTDPRQSQKPPGAPTECGYLHFGHPRGTLWGPPNGTKTNHKTIEPNTERTTTGDGTASGPKGMRSTYVAVTKLFFQIAFGLQRPLRRTGGVLVNVFSP